MKHNVYYYYVPSITHNTWTESSVFVNSLEFEQSSWYTAGNPTFQLIISKPITIMALSTQTVP